MTEREAQLWEHIRSLQAQIDHLVNRDEARLSRIRQLEEDRAVLRERLDQARSKLARRGRWKRVGRGDKGDLRGPSEERPRPSLAVPGVGVISEPPVPEESPRRSLKVATVLDPISETVFAPEFDAIPVSAMSWRDTLEADPPDLLLVESAYNGVDGSWATRIARFGAPSDLLGDLVSWCRKERIPTAFWNKEDPINFDWFIESARLFDFVFTVDGDQIERYRHQLGHDRVDLLQFFAQPTIHYPGPDQDRTGAVAFAGSYYAAKHPERRKQIGILLDSAREFGLHIFDRHAESDDERFRWPDKYMPHVMGGLSYLQTVEAYRRYKVFINVNTVTTSPTMCARRIFELAACATPIVSGPAQAIETLDKRGVVRVARDSEGTRRTLSALIEDDAGRREIATIGREWIAEGNTSGDRVDQLLSVLFAS